MMDKNLLRGIIILALLIPVCAIFIRMLTGRETVSDYAAKHPEQQISAYVTAGVTPEGVTDED